MKIHSASVSQNMLMQKNQTLKINIWFMHMGNLWNIFYAVNILYGKNFLTLWMSELQNLMGKGNEMWDTGKFVP